MTSPCVWRLLVEATPQLAQELMLAGGALRQYARMLRLRKRPDEAIHAVKLAEKLERRGRRILKEYADARPRKRADTVKNTNLR